MNKFVRNGLIAAGVLVLSAGSAMAALSTEVSTAVATSKTDITDIGAAVFGVYIALKTIKWVRRAL